MTTPHTLVPALDLAAELAELRPELDAAWARVLESGRFIQGPEVESFEREAAEHLGVRHAVALNSGTDALLIALRLAGVGPGDEVITTPFTFFATAGAIHNAGARPVFVDIEPKSFNIDPDAVGAAISDRTRAVIPVDLFGQLARLEEISSAAGDLPIIEDAAQSIGARRRMDGEWTRAGASATIGTFSFFPSKKLGG